MEDQKGFDHEREIEALERRLAELKPRPTAQAAAHSSDTFHNILLLSDSALPIGSFAFSSGLESFLAHTSKRTAASLTSFRHFVELSLTSLQSTALPYVIAAYSQPQRLKTLDNDFDASLTCSVARRASVSQGRALISIWERSFRDASSVDPDLESVQSLQSFCSSIKTSPATRDHDCAVDEFQTGANGHLPPLFGVLCAALTLTEDQTVYTFLMNHAKTIISAGIRSSVLGPYQAQAMLASGWLRQLIADIQRSALSAMTPVEDAGQNVPMLDIWGGRHEIVYSRIFNS